MKPFGYGYIPKSLTKEEVKENLRRWAWFGEAHVDNLWSETLKYIEELENTVTGYESKKMMSEDKYKLDAQDILEFAIYKIASKRYDTVDDYIRIAKQAIADIEHLDIEEFNRENGNR